MKDMQTHLETLRNQTAECEKISKLTTDNQKRELFTKLAQHYNVLASELERAIKKAKVG